MKVFDRPFFKKVVGDLGQHPQAAPADAKFLIRRFCFFLRLLAQKEWKRSTQCNPETIHSKALGSAEGSLFTNDCTTCTKQTYKTYILCRNPHLTKRNESGRIFKVARATETWRKQFEKIEKSQKFSKKLLKNLLTNRKRCDIIIRLSRRTAADIGL